MKACITGASGLGLLVNRAQRSEGVFECLVKTVSREMEKKAGTLLQQEGHCAKAHSKGLLDRMNSQHTRTRAIGPLQPESRH